MRHTGITWFILRREPLYHKLQYSKVPKYDSSAAILGTVIGAFGGYLALATVGSGGTDLTDLTTLAAWALVVLGTIVCSMELRNTYTFVIFAPISVWVRPLSALFLSIASSSSRSKKR
jgi:predicted anti-sigma-YlaC factor YlaD